MVHGALKLKLKCEDGRALEAKVVRVDKDIDLALLKVDGSFTPVNLAAASAEPLGKNVFTLGYPRPDYMGETIKATRGIISGLEGYRGSVYCYQMDASIQPGNSGGPVSDETGSVIGISVASFTDAQNVNYAIKKNYLIRFIEKVPECIGKVHVGEKTGPIDFVGAVERVRKSCALVMVFK